MGELTSNSSNNKGRTFSPIKSPPVFFRKITRHQPSASHIPLPPCIWDVEYPRQQQRLRRSVSVSGWRGGGNTSRGALKPTVNLSSSSSGVRSLWSAENKEYLEMRFGLLVRVPDKENPNPIVPIVDESERDLKEHLEQEHQRHRHDASEESSIFSNPDCSSFSSGNSEDPEFTSARDEPVSTKKVEEEDFLDYRLEEGKLVDNPRALTRTSDHPAKRHNVDSSRLESPRRKLCSSSGRPSGGALTHDDRYPVWSGGSSSSSSSLLHCQLIKSYRECSISTTLKPSDSSSASVSTDHHRRSLLGSPVPRFNFSPGRFRGSKLSEPPDSSEIHPPHPPPPPQQMAPRLLHQSPQPEVHCKSFFLRKPGSFIRRRKRAEESRPMKGSDGYRVAQLHWDVRNDHHSYTFVIEGTDDSSPVLVARTPRGVRRAPIEEEGEDSTSELVCTFYSEKRRVLRSQSWKPSWSISGSAGSESTTAASTSEIVASLKLRRTNAPGEEIVDLEFVLLNASAPRGNPNPAEEEPRLSFSSWEVKKSPHSVASSVSSSNPTGLKRNWWSLMPGSPVLRRKSSKPAASPGPPPEEDVDVLKEIWKEMEAAESVRRARAANRLQELAAIVVAGSSSRREFEAPISSSRSKTPSRSRSNSLDSSHSNYLRSSCFTPMNLTVVLPAGQHGMPTEGISGPSPLIKRWRSGNCDCGGWDLGCQLQILRGSQGESLSKLLDVSLQGTGREGEGLFSMVGLSNGLFSVRFKEPLLSPLQAFATAVSVLYRGTSQWQGCGGTVAHRESEQWSKALGLPNPLLHLERL